MKKIILAILALLMAARSYPQDYLVEIPTENAKDIGRISRAVSIDNVRNGTITAYANESELAELRKILSQSQFRSYRMSLSKSGDYIDMADKIEDMKDWAHYPTYETYIEMMEDFARRCPELCELVEIGKSVENRKILALRLTAEGDTTARPRFFLTSTMHGDETCGFILSLRLIDYLLTNYGTDSATSRILDNIVLYINPLSNPDGTYRGGNATVARAQRYNANNIDLNRNFPQIGAVAKSTSSYEPETVAMMDFAKSRRFTMSANMHGGDEVLNYPWDSFYEYELSLPDKPWFEAICSKYIATLRAYAPNAMKSVNDKGYVFGSEWYKVSGGRQDWMMASQRCREITIELSNIKLLRCDLLDEYWQRNRDALIGFLGDALQGISGRVTSMDGKPIEAQIYLDGHDANFSSVKCDKEGMFFRPTLAGRQYEVCAVADGYETQCKPVSTTENELTVLDFTLNEGISEYTATENISVKRSKPTITIIDDMMTATSDLEIDRLIITDILGRTVATYRPHSTTFRCPTYNFNSGIYVIRIQTGTTATSTKIFINK